MDQSSVNVELIVSAEIADPMPLLNTVKVLLLEHLCLRNQALAERYHGAILIFLPSLESIKRVNDALESHPVFGTAAFQIHPLHSTISSENQTRVFHIPPRHIRKIVLGECPCFAQIHRLSIGCSNKHRRNRFVRKHQSADVA